MHDHSFAPPPGTSAVSDDWSAPHRDDPQSRLRRWDDGCRCDEARESFVIPELARLVRRVRPRTVIDVGARTGSLFWRLLSLHHDAFVGCRMIALEKDREAATFMTDRFASAGVTVVDRAIDDWAPDVDEPALFLLCYTALELTGRDLRRVFSWAGSNGDLVVVLPDALEDLRTRPQLRRYALGEAVRLTKVDRFTGEPYPYIARRPELWLRWCLDTGLRLCELSTYRTRTDRTHFLYHLSSAATVT